MYDTIEEIEALIGEEETVSLEFKAGRMLEGEVDRTELVKDVTAFANAAGGTIIVGVAEERTSRIATRLEPVSAASRVTIERLTEIIKSNTEPVFGAFRIRELQHQDGRVFVIEIDQADTAHQNKRNFLYYQRLGPTSSPMYDFMIRDVMNRRAKPKVSVALGIQLNLNRDDTHVYEIRPKLLNEGNLNANHWVLQLDLPLLAARNPILGPGVPFRSIGTKRRAGNDFSRYEINSGPLPHSPEPMRLLPGQESELTVQHGYPLLELVVNREIHDRLTRGIPPDLHWTLFLDNSPRQEGSVPFEQWCRF